MGLMKLLGTSFSTILNSGNPTADRTITFPDASGQVALTSDSLQQVGVGQTWQNVTGSRVAGTTYTNSTGKPIMVTVHDNASGGILTVGGVALNRATNNLWYGVIVPNGATYSFSLAFTNWSELR